MKKRAAFLAAVAVFVTVDLYLSARTHQKRFEDQLAQSIRQQVRGRSSKLILKDATDFAWDHVLVFGPYTSKKLIEQALGTRWTGSTEIESSDSINLLIFEENGKVVRYAEIGRSIDFLCADSIPEHWSPAEAVFPVRTDGPRVLVDVRPRRATNDTGDDVVQCNSHGKQDITYVCQHLAESLSSRKKVGFFCSGSKSRSDAWCAECEKTRTKEGEWNDRSEKALGIRILCGACYDEVCRFNSDSTQ